MNQKKKQFIFVCGTDTGVGKTVVTGALCVYLQSQGIKAGAYKPLESGGGGDAAASPHAKRVSVLQNPRGGA